MKIVLWGTYDTGKPRIRILREGLRRHGVEVIECHAEVWERVKDKSTVKSLGRRLALARRWLACYPVLVWRYLCLPKHDLVLTSYPGFLDTIVIKPFATIRRTQVVWDVFMSAHDTVVDDRSMLTPRHPLAAILWIGEWVSSRAASFMFLDTRAHARRFEARYRLPAGHCGSVWVGVESENFALQPSKAAIAEKRFDGSSQKVLFYGQLIPLHGVPIIIQAAKLLQHEEVDWLIIGEGQQSELIAAQIREAELPRLTWLSWVSYADLKDYLQASDVSLGIFGASGKADSVIPNKVFQAFAAGCPVITRDSSGIREIVKHCPPCVHLVKPDDPSALAAAVQSMRSSPRKLHRCHVELQARIDENAIGRQFLDMIAARFPENKMR